MNYVRWVRVNDQELPAGSVRGGTERGEWRPHALETYVGRTAKERVVGKIVPFSDCMCIAGDGREQHLHRLSGQQYEVLTFQRPDPKQRADVCLDWVEARDGEIPFGAVEGGREGGVMMYVGQERVESQLLCGKVSPADKCLIVTWNGKEYRCSHYYVLVVKEVDKYMLDDVVYEIDGAQKNVGMQMVVGTHQISNTHANDREMKQYVTCTKEDCHCWAQLEGDSVNTNNGITTHMTAGYLVFTDGNLEEVNEGRHTQRWDDKVTTVRTEEVLIRHIVPAKHKLTAEVVEADVHIEVPFTGAFTKTYKNEVPADVITVQGLYKCVLKQVDVQYGKLVPLPQIEVPAMTDEQEVKEKHEEDKEEENEDQEQSSSRSSPSTDHSSDHSDKDSGSSKEADERKPSDELDDRHENTEEELIAENRDVNNAESPDQEKTAESVEREKSPEAERSEEKLPSSSSESSPDPIASTTESHEDKATMLPPQDAIENTAVNSQVTDSLMPSPAVGEKMSQTPSPDSARRASAVSDRKKSKSPVRKSPLRMLLSRSREPSTDQVDDDKGLVIANPDAVQSKDIAAQLTNGSHALETEIDGDLGNGRDIHAPSQLMDKQDSKDVGKVDTKNQEPLMGPHDERQPTSDDHKTEISPVSQNGKEDDVCCPCCPCCCGGRCTIL